MIDTIHFEYIPPALSESEMQYIEAKYGNPDESRLIYHIRAPIITRLEEMSLSNDVDEHTSMMATILRFMYIDAYERRFSKEWMLMCSFATDQIIYSEDKINSGEYTNQLTRHLLMDRFPINMPAYSWLDRQYCYKWIYRFDHPETLTQIEQELVIQFGSEAQNLMDLVSKLREPSKLYQVARRLSVEEIVALTKKFYADNTALSMQSITDLLFEEAEKLRSGASSTSTV